MRSRALRNSTGVSTPAAGIVLMMPRPSTRQHPIDDHDIIVGTHGEQQSVATIRNRIHHVAVFFEAGLDERRSLRVVFDHEQLHCIVER